MVQFGKPIDPVSFQRDALLTQKQLSISFRFVPFNSPLINRFVRPHDLPLSFCHSLFNLSFVIVIASRVDYAFSGFCFTLSPTACHLLLTLPL